jgi:hypothetical protein
MEPVNFFVENKIILTIIHVLGAVFGMGSAIMSDLLFNFYSRDKSLDNGEKKTLKFLSNAVWISLIFIILSGAGIFLTNPEKYMASNKFISKMVVMVILLINGLFLHKFVSPHFGDRGLLKFENKRPLRQIAFACGAVSLISWFVVCILGILSRINYTFKEFLLGYAIFTICGIIFALIVEKKTFK